MATETAKAEPDVHLGARVPASLREALVELAHRNDRSVSAEVRLALKAWLGDE